MSNETERHPARRKTRKGIHVLQGILSRIEEVCDVVETNPKLVNWGLAIMFVIGPIFSWYLGRLYGTIVSSGFAAAYATALLLILSFAVGVYLIVKGFKKTK